MSGVVFGSTVENWIGLGLAVALVVFLAVALLYPERF